MATYESCEGMNSNPLTSYAEVFPVNRTLLPGSAKPQTMTATSGPKCSESFARLSPDGLWLKMCQGCFHPRLDGSVEEFSGTWPRAGILSGGTAYQRQPLARRIKERESSSSENWLTPDAHCTRGNLTRENLQRRMNRGMPITLNDQIQHPEMWPTPRAGKITSEKAESWLKRQEQWQVATPPLTLAVQMWSTPMQSGGAGGPGCSRRSGGENLRTVAGWRTPTVAMVNQARGRDPQRMQRALAKGQGITLGTQCHAVEAAGVKRGGQLNPDWVECLMGFPQGWTQLDASGPQGQGKNSTTGSRRE